MFVLKKGKMMRNLFIFFLLLFLDGCVTPEEIKTVFIDSNITADVYIGDVNVGTTPYVAVLSSEEREMISLHKTGYKTAELPLNIIYKGNYRPGFFYAVAGITSSNCDKYNYYHFVPNAKRGCEYIPMITGASILFPLGITVSLHDMTTDPRFVQYDRDSYFVEMIPENKKAFTKEELKQMRTRLMVLRTFNELKVSSPEYAFTLSRLTGKPFIPPAPDMTPGTYLRLIEK